MGKWAVAVVLIIGVAVRVALYAGGRGLWYDEVLLAFNLQARNFAELTLPLDGNQGAPLGFLWASKALTLAFGMNEWALRLLPLLAGVLSLLLIMRVARRFSALAVPFALALLATAPDMLYYSHEFKQYMLDVCLALGITLLAMRYDERPTRARWGALAFVGAGAVWCSHPSAFVLAGVGAVLWVRGWRERAGALLALGVCWAVSFAWVYFAAYRPLSQSEHLNAFWAGGFAQANPLWWLGAAIAPFSLITGAGNFSMMGVLLMGFVAGLRVAPRTPTAFLLAPIAITLGAAILHLYPFRDRLILFLAPALAVIAAEGFASGVRSVATQKPQLARALLWAFLLAFLLKSDLPRTRQEVRDALPAAQALAEGLPVYADLFTYEVARFYGYDVLPLSAWQAGTPALIAHATEPNLLAFVRPQLVQAGVLDAPTLYTADGVRVVVR
jgi:4-amino-4-deoxy-L-arabinose transferase-like glycosyltransferase